MSPLFPHAAPAKRTLFSAHSETDSEAQPRRPSKTRRRIAIDDERNDGDNDDSRPILASAARLTSIALPQASNTVVDMESMLTTLRTSKTVDGSVHPSNGGLYSARPDASRMCKGGADDDVESTIVLGTFAHGQTSTGHVPDRARARNVLGAVDLSGDAGQDEYSEKNPWSVDIRDAKRRRPGDDGYDPDTLYVPHSVLEKMSPFQRQYWEVKSKYYSTVLMVKKGAFMEAYDIDADIVHKELGLNYTGGGRASMRCAGVPESALNRHAARLIDLGYKVGIVAQTETANAADKRKAASITTSKVCHRALVRVLTRATVTDDELLRDHRARYVMSLYESPAGDLNDAGEIVVGVCHVDAASGRITLGEFLDDNRRSWTEKLLATLQPLELIVPSIPKMSPRMRGLVRWVASGSSPVDVLYRNPSDGGFPIMTQEWLSEYADFNARVDAGDRVSREYLEAHPLAARAFGAVARYLADLLIDKETLSLGNYTLLPPLGSDATNRPVSNKDVMTNVPAPALPTDSSTENSCTVDDSYDPKRTLSGGLQMDAATIANLEVLANVVDGSERDALISVIDHAVTAAGRRLLRRWIVDPLAISSAINDRLNAVETLNSLDEGTINAIRRQLASCPDLERALPRLHQFAVIADVAVMFDDTNARRVKDFLKVLRGLESTLDAVIQLGNELPENSRARRLSWLLAPGGSFGADVRDELEWFFGSAFDVTKAEKDGDVIPEPGASPAYDMAKKALDSVEEQLEDELSKWRSKLGDRTVAFYHRGKETYQLEVKVTTIDRTGVPSAFLPTSESKLVKRFVTSRIQSLVKVHVDASEAFADVGMTVLRDIIQRFDDKRDVWSTVVKTAAEVDALIGLAIASRGDGTGCMTRPEVLPDTFPHALLETVNLRHPVLATKAGASFVANDTALGGSKETIALVTGSNCSGKSTLSRQVAVSVILAQVGAFVPAASMRLRPFSSLFARAGSRDEIARGRSTFMVEMEEAALIVNTASDRSLVIVDELCSGTTAQDAHAISHATLEHLIGLGCLTIFCTHADALAVEFAGRVGNYTMAADVDEVKKTIVFLYKLIPGVTSHSRGVFCARVAGVPGAVADEAELVSERFDETLKANRDAATFATLVHGLGTHDDERAAVSLLQAMAAR
jgi:DNA mismatch repair protein MSH6